MISDLLMANLRWPFVRTNENIWMLAIYTSIIVCILISIVPLKN